ncbi:MAG: hypothetical protein J2P29_08655, partial [Actinobacteria bacterium]|nr:hypothetical protein [Actinomycetota bacterium]
MPDESVVVGLLYRADWTRLSMNAVTADGANLTLAPGGRYRFESGDFLTGCDGGRPWQMPGDDESDARGEVHWVSDPEPPLPELLCPAWLLVSSQLQVRGRVRACGRDAWDVLVTRRQGTDRPMPHWRRGRIVNAVVDAELGIVLRLVQDADQPEPYVTELVRLDLDVVTDPATFLPPPGSRLGESPAEGLGGGGPAVEAAQLVGGVAAGALGAWIRLRSGRNAPVAEDGDSESGMPPGDPAPEIAANGVPAGPPVRDELLGRLHQGGGDHFAAMMHVWLDVGAMTSQVPEGARRVGFGGVGVLADAVGAHPAAHLISAVRFGGPGQYQIDRRYSARRAPKTIACDGERRWEVRDGRATVGPAKPPPKEIADLADPSWLLQCRLSGGEPTTIDGRPSYRISVARGPKGWLSMTFPAAVAVVDAELGVILCLTYYMGGKPVHRSELRDIATSKDEFRTDLPPDLTVTEETGPFGWS